MQRHSVREAAAGKWPGILAGMGLSDRALSGKHGPCPMCGGKDRFRFDDKEGRGTWFCSQCGAGDGVKLAMLVTGQDFPAAALEIERAAGVVQPFVRQPEQDEAAKVRKLRQTWAEGSKLTHGDEAMTYLAGRDLEIETVPDCLRLHPALPYYETRVLAGRFPAMLARVVAADGTGATLHRTYLQRGHKAPVSSPKKLMAGKPVSGAAVRLFPVAECLGIAEGIETALAAAQIFGVPVWSCISAAGIQSFEPPEGVRELIVFGDHDSNFVGQAAAYTAAHRLKRRGLVVTVKIPSTVGDWLDQLSADAGPRDAGNCRYVLRALPVIGEGSTLRRDAPDTLRSDAKTGAGKSVDVP
jgi:putative DNA primase/helicase